RHQHVDRRLDGRASARVHRPAWAGRRYWSLSSQGRLTRCVSAAPAIRPRMSIPEFTSWMAEHIVRIHHALDRAAIPHAFGGAIANAFCGEPRATTDIDINIFLPETEPDETLRAVEA